MNRVTIPLAVLVPLFGAALIITKRYDFWKSEWLIIASALYTVVFLFAALVQRRNAGRMIERQRAMPPGPPPEGAQPPAELMAAAKRIRRGGAFLLLSIVTLIVLMVWQPGTAFLPPK